MSLHLSSIAKSFPGVRALDRTTLNVQGGSVHALVGENGAGKTTLVRIAFGMEQPDAGEIRVDGRPVRLGAPADAIALGIGLVHQHFTAVPRLTVAENVALGGRGVFDVGRARERVFRIGDETGLVLDPDAVAADLGVAALSRLEIVKALGPSTRTLMLDEPTGMLAPAETADLLKAVRGLAERGTAVVFITHKLDEALAVADEITVLRAGRAVLHARAEDVSTDALARAMLGGVRAGESWGSHRAPDSTRTRGIVVASVRGLSVRDEHGRERLRGASLTLQSGEIVGVAGVEGSGHRELLRALAGRLPCAGTVTLPARVGFVPEDRQGEALLLDRPLYESVALRDAAVLPAVVPWRAIASRTAALLARFDVRARGPRALARTLSGGNQQKLVLARELDDAPALIVAENPTRGLDVGATTAVHARLISARDAGAAVVLHSTDLDELLALSDRVVVTFDGRLREVARDHRELGDAMLGVRALQA